MGMGKALLDYSVNGTETQERKANAGILCRQLVDRSENRFFWQEGNEF